MKKHIPYSKFIQKIIVVIGLFFVFPSIITAQNTNIKSPALETLIEQIDENYVPSGWNDTMNSMEKLSGTIPQIYFTFLGAAMNKQKLYINNNSIASENYKNLNQEIVFSIPDIVDLKNRNTSNTDQLINDNTLLDIYDDAIYGEINEQFNQSYKEYTGKELSQISMSSVLDQKLVGGTSFRKVARKDEDEIGLLGVAVIGPANLSQDNSVKRNGGPGKAKGQICPDRGNEDFTLDTNGIPDDRIHCYCDYENGFLISQYPSVNGKLHGMWIRYEVCSGVRYLRYQHPYINGEKHGEFITYTCYTYQGSRIGLDNVDQYVNGKKQGIQEEWRMTESGKNYLYITRNCVNGVMQEYKRYQVSKKGKRYLNYKGSYNNINGKSTKHGDFIMYHSSGGVQAISRYNAGELISTKCFYKNGDQIKLDTNDLSRGECWNYTSRSDWNED